MDIREQGWECPKCQRIWAPKIAACGACSARQILPLDQVPVRPADPRFTCEAPEWNVDEGDLGCC